MPTIHELQLETSDAHNLHVVSHQADDAVGTVLVIHGFGEHSGCYTRLAALMNEAAFDFVRFDQRGHGKSSGVRGHVDSYEDYLTDVTSVVEHLFAEDPNRLIVIYGHSMGGGVAANWFLKRFESKWEDRITGAVLSAPWFRLAHPVAFWKVWLIDGLSRVIPWFGVPTEVQREQLTRDLEILDAIGKDSMRNDRITLKSGIECYRAGRWALEHARQFPVPLLAFHGTADEVTSHEATKTFCEAIPHSRFVLLEDFLHEPHNDRRWEEIGPHCFDWIAKRFSFVGYPGRVVRS